MDQVQAKATDRMGEVEPKTLAELLSRADIHDLLCDYMRAQDRLDPELHRSVFHDDATTDYGAYVGGPDGFVAFAQGVLRLHLANHHMMGQARIEVDGDVALGEVYFQAHHRVATEHGERDLFVAGRYIDRYERRDGRWKIAHRSERVDWARNEPSADLPPSMASSLPWGARSPHDLSCQRDKLLKL